MARVGAVLPAPVRGGRVRVVGLLGEGGQGTVYEVRGEDAAGAHSGGAWALKWYHPHTAVPSQRRALELLVERGSPSDAFLWPVALLDGVGMPGFGYLMPLRPARFRGVADLLTGRAAVPLSTALSLCLDLAHSFLLLHSQGLCYRDISFGNAFFDPRDGTVLVCDCDNVGVDGASSSAVLGTRRFMAPEVVRREAPPSTQTDLHSLAVLLFYVLVVGHPLLGRRELAFAPHEAAAAEAELFGAHPRFVFDPDDASNAPVPGLHGDVAANWKRLPTSLQALFTTAFTRGLADPQQGRVRESVWRRALLAVRDTVAQCPVCAAEHFWEPGTPPPACWRCGTQPPDPLRLVFDDVDAKVVVITASTRVRAHHLHHDYDLSTVVAEVTRHPSSPGRWGLRNTSARPWAVQLPTGRRVQVPPGRSVGLVPGATIDFGGRTAVLAA